MNEFVALMAREVPGLPSVVLDKVLEDADTIQRLAVAYCNRELSKAEEKEDADAEERIRAALAPHGVKARFSGDPRGACVKLDVPSGRSNAFSGGGVCVPTHEH